MDDLMIIRLCAEAMELPHAATGTEVYLMNSPTHTYNGKYDPLTNDAQAMALVKKFELMITPPYIEDMEPMWEAESLIQSRTKQEIAKNADLNRAICECVAKLHQAKSTG